MPAAPDSAPATAVTAGILTTIRNRIASGELPMGTRISKCRIARELGVEPAPVREALVQLQVEGLVEVGPESGLFVFDMTVQEMRQLCAARAALEVGAVRSSRTAASVRSLRAIVDQAEDALDAGELSRCHDLDGEFHESLVAASGNVYMIRYYRGIADRLRALRQRLPRERIGLAIAQHRLSIDSLAVGEPAIAAQALENHIWNVERSLTHTGAGRERQN
jgi:DNA-binding GntR family transcriptional regulator